MQFQSTSTELCDIWLIVIWNTVHYCVFCKFFAWKIWLNIIRIVHKCVRLTRHCFCFWIFKWFLTCLWHQKDETTNSPIRQFTNLKCCKKAREPFKTLFNGLHIIYYFKRHFQLCFFILKALKDILQHFKFVNWQIGEFVVSFFWCHKIKQLSTLYLISPFGILWVCIWIGILGADSSSKCYDVNVFLNKRSWLLFLDTLNQTLNYISPTPPSWAHF